MSAHLLRSHLLLSVVLLGAAALSAPGTPRAATGEHAVAVTITGFAFSPARTVVPAGGSVTWTNGDDIPHTVTSAATPRVFSSEALDTGDHYTRVFAKPGTYRYYCAIHPHMQGVVVVQ